MAKRRKRRGLGAHQAAHKTVLAFCKSIVTGHKQVAKCVRKIKAANATSARGY